MRQSNLLHKTKEEMKWKILIYQKRIIQKTLNQDYIQSGLKMDYLNLSQTQIRSHLQ